MLPSSRKKLIIAAVIFGLVVVVMIIFAVVQQATRRSNAGEPPKITTQTDEYSGETVTTTEGKVDEGDGDEAIIFLGSSKLLEYGLTSEQIQRIRSSLDQYSLEREANGQDKITRASVDVKTYQQFIDEETEDLVNAFSIILNNDSSQRYYLQLMSLTVSDYTILIYADDKSTVVFDSNTAPMDGL